jgi:hypothetical protein
LEVWRNQAQAKLQTVLKKRDEDPFTEDLKAANQHIGQLTQELEVLSKEVALRRAIASRESLRLPCTL